jgi:hypothetical protein
LGLDTEIAGQPVGQIRRGQHLRSAPRQTQEALKDGLSWLVVAGLDPAIHVFISRTRKQDVDHRDKPGDDAECVAELSVSLTLSAPGR